MLTVISRKTPPCRYCVAAEGLLRSREIEYETRDATEGETAQFLQENGIRSVPAVFVGGVSMDNFIGGYEQLKEWVRRE